MTLTSLGFNGCVLSPVCRTIGYIASDLNKSLGDISPLRNSIYGAAVFSNI